jgi:hypothetical protein
MATIEARIRHVWLGLICAAVAAIGVVFLAVFAKLPTGFSFPHHFLPFILLSDAYTAGFFVDA